MTLRFDAAFSTVLVVCEGCPSRWRELHGTHTAAERAARIHLEVEHSAPADVVRVRFLSAERKQRSRRH